MALIDRWREHMAKAVKTLPFCRMHGVHLTVSVAARQHSHAMGKPESGAGNPDPIIGNSCLFNSCLLAGSPFALFAEAIEDGSESLPFR